MYYKFKKEDLNKLFKIEDINLNVNKLIINKYIEDGNLLKKDTDNEKTVQEKNIAYLIVNHDEICVSINEDKNVNNPNHLLAGLMTDAREIVIKISDSKVQEEFIQKYNVKNITFRESNNLSINEDFLLGLTQDGWDNKAFILKKLSSFDDSYSNRDKNQQLALELVNYIPEEQWEDEDFINKFLDHPHLIKLIESAMQSEKNKTFDILLNKKILHKSVELKNSFLIHHYVKIYNELTNKDSYGNYSLNKNKNNNSIKSLLQKEKDFISEIEPYFKQIDFAKKIIQLIDSQFFDLFDSQLKKNPDFKEEYITLALKHLESKSKGSSAYIGGFTALVGVDSFTDKRIQEFALKNGNIIYDKTYQPLLAAEVVKNNNEEIAKLISIGQGTDFLWEYFSKEQKLEKVIIIAIMSKNPKIYNKLAENLRLDKEIFKTYYTTLKEHDLVKDFKIGKINKEFFNSFNEEQIIDLITVIPKFLLEEKFPEHYFDNPKVMSNSNHDYQVFNQLQSNNERFKKTIEKVFCNKELSIPMLERRHTIFELLSDTLKSDMEVLEVFVKNTYDYSNLPAKVYYNKNLLLHILQRKPDFVEKIPAEYFKDQDFLLRIFDKIDKKELNEKVLNSLPIVINEILNTSPLKIGEYSQFFMKTFTHMNLEKKLTPGKNIKIKQNKI